MYRLYIRNLLMQIKISKTGVKLVYCRQNFMAQIRELPEDAGGITYILNS